MFANHIELLFIKVGGVCTLYLPYYTSIYMKLNNNNHSFHEINARGVPVVSAGTASTISTSITSAILHTLATQLFVLSVRYKRKYQLTTQVLYRD